MSGRQFATYYKHNFFSGGEQPFCCAVSSVETIVVQVTEEVQFYFCNFRNFKIHLNRLMQLCLLAGHLISYC